MTPEEARLASMALHPSNPVYMDDLDEHPLELWDDGDFEYESPYK